MRTVIVAAVSTGAQATEDKYSIPQQLEVCRATCEQRGWTILQEISIPGHSRNYDWLHEIVSECPEYGRLVKVIESQTVDLVVCRDYDRLWRTDALRAQLTALCRQYGVQIFSLNQPIEVRDREHLTVGSDSRLIIEAMSGVISQIENEARKRRHRLGMVNRARRGLPPATPAYGYRKDGDRVSIIPAEAQWVQWMYERRLEGYGFRLLMNELNDLGVPSPRGTLWSIPTVRRIVHRPFYAGRLKWRGEVYDGIQEPIIDRELWDRVQRVNHAGAAWHFPQREIRHPLVSLAICGYCGVHMIHSSDRYAGFRCGRYLRSGGRRCQCNWNGAGRVGAYVLDAVLSFLDNPQALAEHQSRDNQASRNAELGQIQTRLTELGEAKERLLRLFETGKIAMSDIIVRYEEVSEQIQRLEVKRSDLEEHHHPDRTATNDLQRVLDRLPHLSPGALRAVYMGVIESVELRKGQSPIIRWL